MEPQLLKTDEVADILQVGQSFSYKPLNRNEIPSVHIGNTMQVRPEDLQRYISDKALQAPVVPGL